jgi:VanZ family protein
MKKILRIIPSILVMTGLFILSALPGQDPFLNSFHLSDKIEHIIAYFVLGASVCLWIPSQKWLAKPLCCGVLILILCTLFSISDEYHQSFVPGRSGNDLGDLAANFIGSFFSLIVYFIALKLRAILRREPKQ